jgi:hypothetical protein
MDENTYKCNICGEYCITTKVKLPQLVSVPKECYGSDESKIFVRKLDGFCYKPAFVDKNVCEKCITKIIVAIYGLKSPELRENPNIFARYLEDKQWD